MLQLNLLPDVKKEFLHAQRMRNLVITICTIATVASGAAVLILGLILGGRELYKNSLTSGIKDKYAKIQGKQENDNLNNYMTVQNQLSRIGGLKESQPIYSRLMEYLRQLNPGRPNNVLLTSVQAGSAGLGSITISGSTASFATLDNYKNVLMNATIRYSMGVGGDVTVPENLFTSVTVSQASLSQDEGASSVTFTIVATFNEAAFNANTVLTPDETSGGVYVTVPGGADVNLPVFKEGE